MVLVCVIDAPTLALWAVRLQFTAKSVVSSCMLSVDLKVWKYRLRELYGICAGMVMTAMSL